MLCCHMTTPKKDGGIEGHWYFGMRAHMNAHSAPDEVIKAKIIKR
jgi:hypothetical protein